MTLTSSTGRLEAKNPQPIEAEDNRWHDGAEVFVHLTPATIAAIKNGAFDHTRWSLYITGVQTDTVGDLIIEAHLPDAEIYSTPL